MRQAKSAGLAESFRARLPTDQRRDRKFYDDAATGFPVAYPGPLKFRADAGLA